MNPRDDDVSEVSDLSDRNTALNLDGNVADMHQNTQLPDPPSSTPFISREDKEERKGPNQFHAEPLKRYPWALWLLFFYAIAAIPSWAVTCWLSYRPIGISAYDDIQNGVQAPLSDWDYSDRCRRAASIGLSIIAAVGIPVTSAICAKSTVIYCQMKSNRQPSLTLRQTLALADKGWSDLGVIWDLIRPSASRRTRSPLLVLSVFLVGLALLLPILQSAYVSTSHVQVLSNANIQQLIGFPMTPGQMIYTDSLTSIINHITSATMDGSLYDKDPYLWPVGGGNLTVRSPEVAEPDEEGPGPQPTLFTANFPVGTDTGMFRDYILRLNFTLNCENLTQAEYPPTCLGNNPFNRTYTNIDESNSDPFGNDTSRKYRIRICAPGDTQQSPWNATGHRQDISEEFYLDSQYTRFVEGENNFTQHCVASSSLGYFELPNYYNNHTAGDLLENLPPAPTPAPNMASPNDYAFPDPSDEGIMGPVASIPVPGPLLSSVLAIFGNGSFFDTVAAHNDYTDRESMLVCQQLRQPFSPLMWTYPQSGQLLQPVPTCSGSTSANGGADANALVNALFDWLPNFRHSTLAGSALTLAMYSAQKSLLTAAAEPNHILFTNPGHEIQKPNISLAALIVITALLSTQIVCLSCLAIYASAHHTWTHSLDAFALLRMGASLKRDMPLISNVKASEVRTLDERAGWIGASSSSSSSSSSPSELQEDDDSRHGGVRTLAIGTSRRVEPNTPYLTVVNDGSWIYEKVKGSRWVRFVNACVSPLEDVEVRKVFRPRVEHEYRRVKTIVD